MAMKLVRVGTAAATGVAWASIEPVLPPAFLVGGLPLVGLFGGTLLSAVAQQYLPHEATDGAVGAFTALSSRDSMLYLLKKTR